MAYWLMKSEPDAYSIDDMERDGEEPWDGIRNYQVRNMIRDVMKQGDEAIFYHSSCKVPAAVGIVRIVSEAYADPTQFDAGEKYFDARSQPENPRWLLRNVAFVRKLERAVTLKELKTNPDLAECLLNKRGNRLSIFPLLDEEWKTIMALEKTPAA